LPMSTDLRTPDAAALLTPPMYMSCGFEIGETAGAIVPASPPMCISSPIFQGPMLDHGVCVAGGACEPMTSESMAGKRRVFANITELSGDGIMT
jgi:hypothetical protein